MNVDKLKFDIAIAYDCDEGVGCEKNIEDSSYSDAVKLAADLESPTWIDHYYHYISISMAVYDEDGKPLDLNAILDGEYSWLEDYSTSSKSEASEMPKALREFLEDLKLSKDERKTKDIEALQAKIADLEAELAEAKEELRRLQEAKA